MKAAQSGASEKNVLAAYERQQLRRNGGAA
jgi:hypothetical protein